MLKRMHFYSKLLSHHCEHDLFFAFQAASSYEEKVKIFKEAHSKIIGKGGVQIKKIREETDTKIDLPREGSASDVITITGKKENVQKARNMIEAIQKELVSLLVL